METFLWIAGVFFSLLLWAVVHSVFFSEDARGRRRYGADQWARMKEEERRKWEREDAEEQRRQEEAERTRREQDRASKNCPICNAPMTKEKVDEVTIDRCPKGHGVWLDHGEFEELIGDWIEEDEEDEY